MLRSAFSLAFLLALGAVASADKPPKEDDSTKREKVDTAIAEMARLLEAKEYKKVVETFMTPDELKKVPDLDKLVKNFSGEKAEKLLAVLKSLKDAKPVMSDDDKKATYELKEEIAGKKEIVFVKIEKYWYIQGK
jgi:hypothetical protein